MAHHAHAELQIAEGTNLRAPRRVAVLDFETLSGSPQHGALFADLVASHLVGLPGLTLVERSRLRQILADQTARMQLGLPSPDVARALDIDAYLVGQVNSFGDSAPGHGEVHATVRLVNAADHSVLWSFAGDLAMTGDAQTVAMELAQQLSNTLRENTTRTP